MKTYANLNTLDKSQILSLLQTHRDEVASYGVTTIGLFGSYVRNEQKRTSDVDILVDFQKDKKTFRNYINLVYYLEDMLGKPVEVVTNDSLSPYIGHYIKEEAEYVKIAS